MVQAVDPRSLTNKEQKRALPADNVIKEQRNGIIKGRTCANKNQQIKFLKEYESVTSPIVVLKFLFTTLLVDTYKEREVVTFDVPRAYLHAKLSKDSNKERLLLKLTGDFVDIICEVNPEHSENIIYEKWEIDIIHFDFKRILRLLRIGFTVV